MRADRIPLEGLRLCSAHKGWSDGVPPSALSMYCIYMIWQSADRLTLFILMLYCA